ADRLLAVESVVLCDRAINDLLASPFANLLQVCQITHISSSANPWERRRPRLLDSSISFLMKQSRRGRLRSQGRFSSFQGVATRHEGSSVISTNKRSVSIVMGK